MFAILFYCASVNGGAGNIMHTKHKTQYKQNKILSEPNNKTGSISELQNNTANRTIEHRKQIKAGKGKTAQILLFCHYLKKEYQHRRGIKSIGVILSRFKRVLFGARALYQGVGKISQ